jgi:hypothetical protein
MTPAKHVYLLPSRRESRLHPHPSVFRWATTATRFVPTEDEKRRASSAEEVPFAFTISSDIGARNVVGRRGVNMESRKVGAPNVGVREFANMASCERAVMSA